MKNFKFFVVAGLLAICGTASAQFSNTTNTSSSTTGVNEWESITFEYAPSKFAYDGDGDDQSFTALSLGWTRGIGLSKTTPLYLELGMSLQWSFYKETQEGYYGDYDMKFNMVSMKMPFSLGYQFNLSDGQIALAPYAGLDLRLNLFGQMKKTYDDDGEKWDVFDKDDMGKDDKWKRFQVGWHVGAKCTFSQKFTLGVAYGADFSEIAKKTKCNSFRISAGVRF